MLDWFPNADHAALYTAIAHGEFRAVGLDVHLLAPSQTDEPLKLLAAGKVDMAISYEPELLLARDQGLRVVSIGALVQRPLTSIIALPAAHIASVADLGGKTVGTAGIPYQTAMLQAALHAAHLTPAPPSRSTSASTSCRRCCRARSTRRSAATGTTRRSSSPWRTASRRSSPSTGPGCPHTTSSCWWCANTTRAPAGWTCAPSCRPSAAASRRSAPTRRRRPRSCSRPTPRCRESSSWNRSGARCRRPSRRRASPSAGRIRRHGRHFAEWMYAQALTRHPPGAELPPFSNEFLPGQGI